MDVVPTNSKMLSAILLSYQSEKRLEPAVKKIEDHLNKESIPFEIIIIDDGSKDKSPQIASRIAKEKSNVNFYQLSKNYTSPYAQFAGLSVCKGACAVFIPDDFQRPMETVVNMYRAWEAGNKIVINYRETRNDGLFNDFMSNLYYKLMNLFSSINFPPGGFDGFLADREIIDIINTKIHPINTSLVVEVLRLGFSPCYLPSPRPKVEGKSRWTFRKKIKLALDTFFASSSFPIKLITITGTITFLLSLISLLVIVYIKLFLDDRLFGFRIPGWSSIIFILFLYNGLVLLSFGIVAEYIWRIFEEVKGRPGFIIRKKADSDEE